MTNQKRHSVILSAAKDLASVARPTGDASEYLSMTDPRAFVIRTFVIRH